MVDFLVQGIGEAGMISIKKQSTLIRSLFILLCVAVVIVSLVPIRTIRQIGECGTIINYTGVVRGASQRLVKLAMAGEVDAVLIQNFDDTIKELMLGNGKHVKRPLEDFQYQENMKRLNEMWQNLKPRLEETSKGGPHHPIIELSEAFFVIANDTVSAAEAYSYRKSNELQIEMAILVGIIIIALCCAIIYYRQSSHLLKQTNIKLATQAQRDLLTNLYNKITTQNLIEQYLEGSGKGLRHALFVVDVDDFKGINDSQGHLFGDAVLTDIAARMGEQFRDEDIVGRIGGDEFIIFIKNVPSASIVLKKAEILVKLLRQSHPGNGENCKISGSIGIAMCPENGEDFQNLYKKADIALYQAKEKGKDCYEVYSEQTPLSDHFPSNQPRTNEIESPQSGHSFIHYIFDVLYDTKDIFAAVNTIISLTAKFYNIGRVYIYQASEGKKCWQKTFEWLSEGTPNFSPSPNQEENIGDYLACFDGSGVFYCTDISKQDGRISKLYQSQGITSVLQTLIMENGVCKGMIGFSEHKGNRFWTQDEVEATTFIAKIISLFLLRQEAWQKLKESEHATQLILDKLDTWGYVINRNHDLIYVNRHSREHDPSVVLGGKCYSILRNKTAPCKDCPVKGIKAHGDSFNCKLFVDRYQKWQEATATEFTWVTGVDAYLVICHELGEGESVW